LREREAGRATFFRSDTLGNRTGRSANEAPREPGVIGYAHTLVETQPRYAGIVAFLVGRMLVVETLDVGVRARTRAQLPRRDRHARGRRDSRRRRDDRRTLQARAFDSLAACAGAHALRSIAALRERPRARRLRRARRRAESAAATRERDEARRIASELR
jgi:chromosome segregation ATPase